ncbi:MAG TPA: aldo/keto reductase, partial [Anaerolineales bacterium]|nr:aldo/keto reductase [Anaerolineales bacterium]
MNSETVHGISVPKVGFGTWKIGGDSYPDPKLDPASLTALRTALEVGYTHFDTAEGYAAGHSEELVGRAVRETNAKREDLFITTKVSPEHLQYDQVLRACEHSLRRLNMKDS